MRVCAAGECDLLQPSDGEKLRSCMALWGMEGVACDDAVSARFDLIASVFPRCDSASDLIGLDCSLPHCNLMTAYA